MGTTWQPGLLEINGGLSRNCYVPAHCYLYSDITDDQAENIACVETQLFADGEKQVSSNIDVVGAYARLRVLDTDYQISVIRALSVSDQNLVENGPIVRRQVRKQKLSVGKFLKKGKSNRQLFR